MIPQHTKLFLADSDTHLVFLVVGWEVSVDEPQLTHAALIPLKEVKSNGPWADTVPAHPDRRAVNVGDNIRFFLSEREAVDWAAWDPRSQAAG